MRVSCKFCGKEFSAAQVKLQIPIISHFTTQCEKGRQFIENDLFPSLLIIHDDETKADESTT